MRSTRFPVFCGAILAWLFAFCVPTGALAEVTVVISEEMPEASRLALELTQQIRLSELLSASPPNARVAIGRAAFERALTDGDRRPVIAAYLTQPDFDATLGKSNSDILSTAVFSHPDPLDQVALAREILGQPSLASFEAPETRQLLARISGSTTRLKAGDRRIDLLLRQAAQFDAIIVLPDNILNQSNIHHVVRTLYQRRRVLIGYSSTLTRVGALASVYVSSGAIANNVVEMLERLARGNSLPSPAFPLDVSVDLNERLARSLNLPVYDEAVLEEQLKRRRTEITP